MLASQRQDVDRAAGSPPGLLAWQVYFLAWVAGIWGLRHPEPALAAAALLWTGLVLFRKPRLLHGALTLCLVAACFAGGRAHARLVLPEAPAVVPAVAENPGTALVRGQVAEVTDKNFGRLEILLGGVRVESMDNATEDLPGLLAWDWDEPGFRPAPGQNVAVRLKVRPVHGFANAGGADFEWQQRLRGVFTRAYTRGAEVEAEWGARPASFWWDLREHLRDTLLSHLPNTQGGAIVLGLLMGDRSRIDLAVTDELRMAGLSHTLALSGLNVVYVAALGWGLAWLAGLALPRLFLRIPRQKLAILISFPLVAAYVWVGQGSPSLVRSAWMFGFWGLLLLLDRGRALVDGLFLALALIVLLDPLVVFGLSLQLSAVAVAGLAFLYPWLRGFAPRGKSALGRALGWVWDAFCISLAANLAILPVSIWYFGTYPPNFLLNLPWVPVQGLVVQTLGMLGLGLAPLPGLAPVAGALLLAASVVQDWMLDALHVASSAGLFPTWALLRPLWPELLGAGLVLSLAPFCLRRDGEARLGALALLLCGLLLMAWPQARMLASELRPEVRLTLLDVGQSQAVLLDLPGGRRVLVDGGGSMSPTFDLGRSVVGPALTWGRPPRLDAVVFSHPDADHVQGLVWVLRQFVVGRFCTNGQWPQGRLGAGLDAALVAGAPPPQTLRAGESLDLGSGVVLEVLHPDRSYAVPGTNDNSLVLRLVWQGAPLAVLPGDVQRPGIEDMIDRGRGLRAQVLLLPHHGSKSSLSGMLYEGVAPSQAVVSCGYQNQYHFPNPAVTAELAGRGIPLASTAERGMLELVWSAPGGGFSLRSERGQ